MNNEPHSQKEINKAVDGFTKSQKNSGGSAKSDTIFNVSDAGKGDSPRNISDKFKNNYESIFPNSYKPKWMKDLNE